MDPKRKKIYIILIAVCVLLAVGVLLWGRSGTPAIPLGALNPATGTSGPSQTAATTKTINPDAIYPPPQVFPQNKTVDYSVIKSIQALQDFQATKLNQTELGRDNPLNNY